MTALGREFQFAACDSGHWPVIFETVAIETAGSEVQRTAELPIEQRAVSPTGIIQPLKRLAHLSVQQSLALAHRAAAHGRQHLFADEPGT
jgi:hypothetical protein